MLRRSSPVDSCISHIPRGKTHKTRIPNRTQRTGNVKPSLPIPVIRAGNNPQDKAPPTLSNDCFTKHPRTPGLPFPDRRSARTARQASSGPRDGASASQGTADAFLPTGTIFTTAATKTARAPNLQLNLATYYRPRSDP